VRPTVEWLREVAADDALDHHTDDPQTVESLEVILLSHLAHPSDVGSDHLEDGMRTCSRGTMHVEVLPHIRGMTIRSISTFVTERKITESLRCFVLV
jgi:hypothetical protein